MNDLKREIAALDDLNSTELRERWSRLTATPVPRISPKLLRLALAWLIQARQLGGHSREVTRQLDQLARGKTKTARSRAGTRVLRLAFLSPALTQAILAGRQSAGLNVRSLTLTGTVAASWAGQASGAM